MIHAGSQAPVVAEKLHELAEKVLKSQDVTMARIDTITGYLKSVMKVGKAVAQVRDSQIRKDFL